MDPSPGLGEENTEIFLERFVLLQEGQAAFFEALIKSSKECWQSLQSYSNRGMVLSPD